MDQKSRFRRLGRDDACLSSTFFDAAANLMLSLGPSDAGISEQFVAGMNKFARDSGIVDGSISYDQVVATQFAELWRS